MAIPTDYMSDIHEPQLRETMPKGREVVVYHGTSSKHLAKILRHGSLDPTESIKHKAWENTTPGIYVTRSLGFTGAPMYASKASKELGGDPVVIELVVPFDWINVDPDDTKLKETGEMNEAGKYQGVINRPINIKRIRGIMIYHNSNLIDFAGGYSNATEYMPIGKLLDIIKKAIKAGVELGPEYHEMVGERPRGMARNFAPEDIEHTTAFAFEALHDNWFSPQEEYNGKSAYEKALLMFLKNRGLIYSNARNGLKILFDDLHPGLFENFQEQAGEEYFPKPNESLTAYLRRV